VLKEGTRSRETRERGRRLDGRKKDRERERERGGRR